MNYFFISSDQQRFSPFQEAVSSLGDGYAVDEVAQLKEAIAVSDDGGVFFIHLIEPQKKVEEFVKQIRKLSKTAKIIHVIESSKGLDVKKHQGGTSGGDAYISAKTDIDEVREVLETLGVLEGDGESAPAAASEKRSLDEEFANLDTVHLLSDHFISKEMDAVFRHLVKAKPKDMPLQTKTALPEIPGVGMSSNEDNSGLTLVSDFGELSLSDDTDTPATPQEDTGMDLMLSDDEPGELSLSAADELPADDAGELSLTGDLEMLSDDDLSALSDTPDLPDEDNGLKLNDNIPTGESVDFDDNIGALGDDMPLDFTGTSLGEDELSEDAKEKLREIDAIMESTSSQIIIAPQLDDDDEEIVAKPAAKAAVKPQAPKVKERIPEPPSDLDESLVGEDLDLDSLDFAGEAIEEEVEEEKPKKKQKIEKPVRETREAASSREENAATRQMGADLKEISGSYTVEMERAQASIANLRADREELLKRIQTMEEDKVMQNRQTLTIRSELDERKIELTIVRKKLNEEVSDLKDRLKMHDERRLILEEKNRILTQELDKAGQRNKIDLRKVQMRERELEQKLELLKSDAETQIRHRDLKILELKRKIDSMEFDMESISTQEKKSVESRFELEDKLDKAIKTLRSAITVLEEESDRDSAVQALKKNIDV